MHQGKKRNIISSIWRKHILQTDDVDPQWRQMIRICGVDRYNNHQVHSTTKEIPTYRFEKAKRELFVPKVPLRDYVEIFIIPDKTKGFIDLRFWWNNYLVHTQTFSIKDFPSVHF